MDSTAIGALFATMGVMMFFLFAILIIELIAAWKMFTKAGRPGWAAIIPFYNVWVWGKLAFKDNWKTIGLLVSMICYSVFSALASSEMASADGGVGAMSLLMSLFALVFLVFDILLMISTAKAFGKGTGFAVGLIFLSCIFLPILAFSKDIRYIGPDGIGGMNGGFAPQGYPQQPMPGDAPQERPWQ